MNMKDSFRWDFFLTDKKTQLCLEKAGTEVLKIMLEDGVLSASFMFSVNERPLTLKGEAKAGDSATIIYRPFRIELYIEGKLCDEEWQYGEALFSDARIKEKNITLTKSDVPEKKTPPTVTASFTGAEGWMPGGGVFCGDCMPYSDSGRYHVLYLKDRHHHGSKWGKGAHQWSHISTSDLIHWDVHPDAVEIDDPAEGSICTGSHIFDGGRHWLYYSVRQVDASSAPIRRSVSDDGYHYEKDREFSFFLSEKYCGARARDPKVVKGEDGTLHVFVTTTDLEVGKGCLAHLVSHDGEHFEEIGNIYTSPTDSEPECPDYFEFGGYYYLTFSHHGKGEYLISEKPFTDWKKYEVSDIPCSTVPKCAVWNDRIIFTGFSMIRGYAGTLTFMEAEQTEDGKLFFKKLGE